MSLHLNKDCRQSLIAVKAVEALKPSHFTAFEKLHFLQDNVLSFLRCLLFFIQIMHSVLDNCLFI